MFIPKYPMPDNHDVYHGMKPAKCAVPWKLLVGSDRVRKCEVCGSTVYLAEGLDNKQLLSLIHETEPDRDLSRIFHTHDGCVTLDDNPCLANNNWRSAVLYGIVAFIGTFLSVGLFAPFEVIEYASLVWLLVGFVTVGSTKGPLPRFYFWLFVVAPIIAPILFSFQPIPGHWN